MCTVAGSRESEIKGCLQRFEDILAFIDEVVVSKEEWSKCGFRVISEKEKGLGQELTLADIKREVSLKLNTYKK